MYRRYSVTASCHVTASQRCWNRPSMAGVCYPQHSTYIDPLTPCTLSDSPILASLPPGIRNSPQGPIQNLHDLGQYLFITNIYLLIVYPLLPTPVDKQTGFYMFLLFYMFLHVQHVFGLHQITLSN